MRGFRQYATEVVVYTDRVTKRLAQTPDGARQVRRGDGRRLYQLYRKVTPQGVSQLEAPTYRDWRALHGEWTGRLTARGSNKEELGGERIELGGWVKGERSSGARPSTLSVMVMPERPGPDQLPDLGRSLHGEPHTPAAP